MWDGGTETYTAEHFSLRCAFFVTERLNFLNNVYDKHFSSQNLNEESMIDILLYGCDKFNERDNKEVFLHTNDYSKSTNRFERSLNDYRLLKFIALLFILLNSLNLFCFLSTIF